MYIIKINNILTPLEFKFKDFETAMAFAEAALDHCTSELEICFIKQKDETVEES